MLEKGSFVYYIDENQIYSGNVIDVESVSNGYKFSIDTYGSCDGFYVISSTQLGISVFLSEDEAKAHITKDGPSGTSQNYC